MVQLIVGKKGEGKTKVLLDKVNAEVKQANGTLVYLDKSRNDSQYEYSMLPAANGLS